VLPRTGTTTRRWRGSSAWRG